MFQEGVKESGRRRKRDADWLDRGVVVRRVRRFIESKKRRSLAWSASPALRPASQGDGLSIDRRNGGSQGAAPPRSPDPAVSLKRVKKLNK
ncbi:hypothetical protein E2C01_083588 [Portunus trituberculatus]|uniref:Uncharacterized protein n=1 Tax=Portunus trituberculatus TaxID=210409 RepID=A0A5B7IVK7_PORTR|nr:hypothetical protein [Portunus trituberculatus]